MFVGSTLVYINGDKDLITGEGSLGGVPILYIKQLTWRRNRETFKSKTFVERMVREGTWKLERPRRERVRL